jgi:hypothetical protein
MRLLNRVDVIEKNSFNRTYFDNGGYLYRNNNNGIVTMGYKHVITSIVTISDIASGPNEAVELSAVTFNVKLTNSFIVNI